MWEDTEFPQNSGCNKDQQTSFIGTSPTKMGGIKHEQWLVDDFEPHKNTPATTWGIT
jgi:hypothetical protein